MTLVAAAALEHLGENPDVVELGSQTFRPGNATLDLVADRLKKMENFDPGPLERLAKKDKKALRDCVSDYYEALGFSRYVSIDVNAERGSLVMDLNTNLAETYGYTDTFSLVTNNGTGEHIFNQASVFENMHRLTRVGGLMAHVVPFLGTRFANHGFYSFHPGLYFDLAAANGYRIRAMGFADREALGIEAVASRDKSDRDADIIDPILRRGKSIPLESLAGAPGTFKKRASQWFEARMGRRKYQQMRDGRLARALRRMDRRSKHILVFALLEKTTDREFQAPFQGRYHASVHETVREQNNLDRVA